jgi:Planctomycete cytochrome C
MDPKGAGSELQESRGAAPLLRRTILKRTVVVLCAVALAGATLAGAALAAPRPLAAATPPAEPRTFARDVAPVLDHWCVSCHGGDAPHGGLRLDSFDGVIRGGDAGPAVVAGDPAGSLLVAKIERRHRPSMPPRRRFPAPLVALIRDWIAAGAPP